MTLLQTSDDRLGSFGRTAVSEISWRTVREAGPYIHSGFAVGTILPDGPKTFRVGSGALDRAAVGVITLRADVGIGPYKGKIPCKCKKHGPPAAFSATRKEEKKMKKDDLFIYMIPGRCEEKKW